MNVVQGKFDWRGKLTPLKPEDVQYIIIHHAAAETAAPEAIHKYHLSKGWTGIGYNEYIRKDGTVFICRGDNVGAHTANCNSKSYGICVEGNYDVEKEMPEAQFKALVERIMTNKARFANLKGIKGHRDFASTACPGKYFPWDKLIAEINKHKEQQKTNTEKIYRVQVGAFKSKENAEKMLQLLKEKGFDAFIREEVIE